MHVPGMRSVLFLSMAPMGQTSAQLPQCVQRSAFVLGLAFKNFAGVDYGFFRLFSAAEGKLFFKVMDFC